MPRAGSRFTITVVSGQGDRYKIGEWIFAPAENLLLRGDTKRRLEHRAARTLELLCRQPGAVVSQADLIDEVWSGRSVSPNSLPVVISDLRQALDDDARQPRHIETVAKRGYRLLPTEPEGGTAPSQSNKRGWRWAAVGAVALSLLLLALQQRPVTVTMSEVVNATGEARYAALARASSEGMLSSLQRLDGVAVRRGARDPAGGVRLDARLVMWSGEPTVMMSATDEEGSVVWTGKAAGEHRIPGEMRTALATLPGALD